MSNLCSLLFHESILNSSKLTLCSIFNHWKWININLSSAKAGQKICER